MPRFKEITKGWWKLHTFLCSILLLIGWALPLWSQNFNDLRFERISSEVEKFERGLSQNSVKCIYQDKLGYLWVGTWDGLNRYDGYKFKPYRAVSSGNPLGLLYSSVTALLEDKDRIFWLGSEQGLTAYHKKSGRFQQYKHQQENSLPADQINCLAEGSSTTIWIGTQGGLCYFDKKTGKICPYSLPSANKMQPVINAFVCDSQNQTWVASSAGLYCINLQREVVRFFSSDNAFLFSDVVQCLFLNPNKQLWIGTNKGLSLYDLKTNTMYPLRENFQNQVETQNDILSVYEDSEENVWIGTNGSGLMVYETSKNKFHHYQSEAGNNGSLSNDYVQCICPDRSGNIWVGTTWKGLNKINTHAVHFNHYYHATSNQESINNNLVWAINTEEAGKLWIATEKGISIFDSLSRKYSYMQHQSGNTNSLVNDQVRRITRDQKGNFWIGTFNSGMDKYRPDTKTFTHFRHHPNKNSLSSDRINHIHVDRRGLLWISTADGLNCYDPVRNTFKVYRHQNGNFQSLSSNNVSLVYEENDSILWIATYQGLDRLDRKKDEFRHFYIPVLPSLPGTNQVIFGIYIDNKGLVWTGTYGNGLQRLNPKSGEIRHYTTKNGLANDVVYDVLPDASGCMWLSTNYGLSRFNPRDESFINYDVRDGIQSYEFNLGACSKTASGELFFGGMNGFNSFFPEGIYQSKFLPPVVITSFKVFNQPIEREFMPMDTLVLEHHENFFTIEFSALDFSNPPKISYQYKLEQFDNSWNYTDANKHFAEYTKVPSGTYIFKVKGTNSQGAWNPQEGKLVIIIKTPWWNTWWFRGLAGLGIALSIFTLIYNRYRQIKKKNILESLVLEMEKQKFSFEQKALRLQMNPHFIFNSLTSIQGFILTHDTERAIHYLSKFAQLMRLILSNSRDSVVSLQNEIHLLTHYLELEKLRFSEKFDFEIRLKVPEDHEYIGIPPMLIQPYVENAILHGLVHKTEGKGKLILEIRYEEPILFVQVLDNGVGRHGSAARANQQKVGHTSQGMMITQERIEQLQQQTGKRYHLEITDLVDENLQACGTRVDLQIETEEI